MEIGRVFGRKHRNSCETRNRFQFPQMKEQNSTTEVNNEIKCKQLNGSKTIKQINKMK